MAALVRAWWLLLATAVADGISQQGKRLPKNATRGGPKNAKPRHVLPFCSVGRGKSSAMVRSLPRLSLDAAGKPTLRGATCKGNMGKYHQTCCAADAAGFNGTRAGKRGGDVRLSYGLNGTVCMPTLVIFGAQKSGSTALAGYLATGPNVRFARRKEVHYFDSPQRNCQGTASYLRGFAGDAASKVPDRAPDFVTAEATPFYLASPHAGYNMAKQLPARSRLVAVLREPAARAYSEFEMEYRRIQLQRGFLMDAYAHTTDMLVCVAQELHGRSLGDCLNKRNASALRADGRFGMLRVKFKAAMAVRPNETHVACVDDEAWNGAGEGRAFHGCREVAADPDTHCAARGADGVAAADACLATCGACGDPDAATEDDESSGRGTDLAVVGAFASFLLECFAPLSRGANLVYHARSPACAPEGAPRNLRAGLALIAPRLLFCAARAAPETRAAFVAHFEACIDSEPAASKVLLQASDADAWAAFTDLVKRRFFGAPDLAKPPRAADAPRPPPPPLAALVINCFPPPAAAKRAKLGRGQRVVLTSKCLPPLERLPPKDAMFHEAAALQKCAKETLGSYTAVAKSNAAAHAFVEDCIGEGKINGGIQSMYVYRSLYATQLRANFLHHGVSPESILVLDQAELRHRPKDALKKVHGHVGLPSFAYAPELLAPGSPLLAKSIAETFDHFDESIGWSLDGEKSYDTPIPERLNAGLIVFFQAHNADLFDLLQVPPFDGWSLVGSHKDLIAKHSGNQNQPTADAPYAGRDPYGAGGP